MTINDFRQQMREAKVPGYELGEVEINGESFLTYSDSDFFANMVSSGLFTGEDIPDEPIIGGLVIRKK